MWEVGWHDFPPIEIGGYKMLDVIPALKKVLVTNRNGTQ
jgi:hypothetical protein